MERSSSTDYSNEMYGSVLIFRNDGKEGPLYDLSRGTTTIGASIDADIRLKILDDRLEDVHCLLEVKENGIAVIINKSLAAPVKVNGDSLKKFKILKHEDYFEVLAKRFQYFNDNVSQEDYQRNHHHENRKSVAPVLQTKTTGTKIPVHQQALKATKRERFTTFVPSEKCSNRKSGVDGSKTTSKLVVSKALSKLPKPRRRLSLNLVPEIVGGKRKSITKKTCDCCMDLIDFSSPRKSILIKTPVGNGNLSPKKNKLSTKKGAVKEMDISSLAVPVDENTDLEDTGIVYENIADEETPETSQRLSRRMNRFSIERTSLIGHTNNAVLNFHERTQLTAQGNSRNETKRKTSSLVNTPGENDSPLHSEPIITETSRRYSGLQLRSPVKNLPGGNDLTPVTGRASLANKRASIDVPQDKNVSMLSLDEKTPKTNPRSSRIAERSLNKKRKSVQEDVGMIMPSEEETSDTSRRLSSSMNRSSKKISSVSYSDDLNVPFNEITPETCQQNSRNNDMSSSRKKATSIINVDTPETSRRFTRNMEQSPEKKRESSVINFLQDHSTPETRQRDFRSTEETPKTNLRSSRIVARSSDQRNRSSIDYVHKEDEMMNLGVKTPENNKHFSNSMNKSANKISSVQDTNNLNSLEDNDATAGTSRRYSTNTGRSSTRRASSIGDVEEKVLETSSLEEKTPRANVRSSRVIERCKETRTSLMVFDIHGEGEMMPSKTGTPETSETFSKSENTSYRKRTSSYVTLNGSTSEPIRRFSKDMDKESNLAEQSNLTSETSQITMDRCSTKRRTLSVGHIFGENTVPLTTETPENNKRVSRSMASSSIKRKSSIGGNINLTIPLCESTPANIQRYSKHIDSSSTAKGRISSVVHTLDVNDSILPLETGTPSTNTRVSRNTKYSLVKRTSSVRNLLEEDITTKSESGMNINSSSEENIVSPIGEDLSRILETRRSSRIKDRSSRRKIRSSFNYDNHPSLLDDRTPENRSESLATRRNGSSTDDLQKEMYASMHSVEETQNQSSIKNSEDIEDIDRSPRSPNKKPIGESSLSNESLIELYEDDIQNDSGPSTSSYYVDDNENNSRTELSESDLENESTQFSTHSSASRKSSVKRSSRRKTYPIDECADKVSKSSNRKSFIPNGNFMTRNSSVIAVSDDDLENELDPASGRRSSNRRRNTPSSSTRQSEDGQLEDATGSESLLELSENNLNNESDQYIHSTSITASGIGSTQRRKTYSLDQSNNDLADEVFESRIEAKKRKSSSRGSLRANSSSTELSNDLENSWEHSRRSSNMIVDLTTPNPSAKKRRSNVQPYQPKTEEITPTTPENKKSTDVGFKTPLNTPGLFNEIKKSMLKSRSRTQNSSSNLMEEFNKEQGLKRPRESIGDSRQSIKKMKLIINEDDTFEESHFDSTESVSFESDSVLEESSESFVQNITDGTASASVSNNETIEDGIENPQEANKLKMAKSPRNDLTHIVEVKKMFTTPKNAKPPKNDLTEIVGVKKMLATPKNAKPPKNDLTEIVGVKKMFATPKNAKPPKNDLTEIVGVKKMFATPKKAKSPKNDLTEIVGVKKMLATPKNVKPPKNDLTNVPNLRKIMSPKTQNSPRNDLTDVRGLKRLMITPKAKTAPLNDLSDVEGMAEMFETSGVHRLSVASSDIENNEELFDRIFEKRPVRQYRGKSSSPMGKRMDAYGGDRRKTMGGTGDQSAPSPRVREWIREQNMITLETSEKASDMEDKSDIAARHSASGGRNVVAEAKREVEETTAMDSPLALTRGRRRMNRVVHSPQLKVTRSRKNAKNSPVLIEETSQKLTEHDQSDKDKDTKRTREVTHTRTENKNDAVNEATGAGTDEEIVDIQSEITEPRRGGRRVASKKQNSEETEPPATIRDIHKVKISEETEKVTAESPRTRQRIAKTAQNEDTEKKKSAPRRGRNAKAASTESDVEQVEEKRRGTRAKAAPKEKQVENKVAPRRGRNAKIVQAEATEEDNAMTEEETVSNKAVVGRRGRNAKNVQSEEKEVDDTEINERPAKKAATRRGRNAKAVESDEKEPENEVVEDVHIMPREETVVKKATNRRGRHAKMVQSEEGQETEHEGIVKNATMTKEETVGKTETRRGRNANIIQSEERKDIKEEESVKPAAKRGRKAKNEKIEKDEGENMNNNELIDKKPSKTRGRVAKDIPSKDDSDNLDGKEEKIAAPKREKRGRKTSADDIVGEKVDEVVPVKRGRRGKTATNVEEVQQNPETHTESERKLRGRAKSKIDEQNIQTDSPSNKRPRRNRKVDEEEQESTVVVKMIRSRGVDAAEKVVQNVLDESLTTRQTRTGRRKKHVHFE